MTIYDLRRAYCERISTDPDSIPGRRIMAGDSDKAPGFVAFRDEMERRAASRWGIQWT